MENTQKQKQLAEMQAASKHLITKWIPTEVSGRERKGGFGFIRDNGESVFVHISSISSCSDEEIGNKDLTNFVLVVYSIEPVSKGLSVTKAATLKRHEQRLAELREDVLREEEARNLKMRTQDAVADLSVRRLEELFAGIESNPRKFFEACPKPVIREGDYSLDPGMDNRYVSAQVVSLGETLTVKVFFTVYVGAVCEKPRVYIACEEKREFSFIAEGFKFANLISRDDPLREAAIRLRDFRRQQYQEAQYTREISIICKGLLLAGITDLVDPYEPFADVYASGFHFLDMDRDSSTGEPILSALKWFRQKRKAEIENLLDSRAAELSVETAKRWIEPAYWDSSYDNEANGGDGLKGWGNFVGGGPRSQRYSWAIDIVEKVVAADNVASNRLDISAMTEYEFLEYLKAQDANELCRGDWAREENLKLPQSRTLFTRGRIAAWIRSWRKEGPRTWREWRKPPEINDIDLAKKAETIFISLKERTLRKEGVKKELARKAAENAVEEKKILDLAKVRKNWREMLSLSQRSLRGLNPEAFKLLEKIRVAQQRADMLAGPRRWEREQIERDKAAEKAREQDEQRLAKERMESARFMTGSAWNALDGLKL